MFVTEGLRAILPGKVGQDRTNGDSAAAVSYTQLPDAVVTWAGDHAEVTADGLSMTVYPNKTYLVANGRYLYLPDGVLLKNGTILVPVRELAKALGAQVWWDATDGSVFLTSGTGAIVSGDEYYLSLLPL